MLDGAIRGGALSQDDIAALADLLAAFYRSAPRVQISGADYRRKMLQGIESNRSELARYCPTAMRPTIERVADAQARCLQKRAALFDRRAQEGDIVEGHGDLRPEHVFLGPPPQIIDCLEFEPEFRVVDVADDLALLAVECDLLGAVAVGAALFRIPAANDAPADLVAFYKSCRAALRARLAIWHLKDESVADRDAWRARASSYLALADRQALALQ
jgi:aminoglycoside phosphotransferase family enzyme